MKKLLVIFAAVAFIWVFAGPASALDWNFYGSARMATFYVSDDLGDDELDNGDDDDDEFTWDLQGNSRIGATVKGENLSGRFEFGINDKNLDATSAASAGKLSSDGGGTVTSRRIFGVWDAGWGKIKVGKDYTPVSQFISGQVFGADNGLLGIGTFYGKRQGQIALEVGGFNIALVTQDTDNVPEDTAGNSLEDQNGDLDRYFPKIEASWGMAWDTFNFTLMGGFQYLTWEDVDSITDPGQSDDVDVTSWVFGGDAGITFGALYLKAAASYAQNADQAGWLSPAGGIGIQTADGFWDGDDDMDDTDFLQLALVGGFKLSDMVTFEVGGGWTDIDTDASGFQDVNPWNIYGQAVIQLAPGVWIIPEVGYTDNDVSVDEDEFGPNDDDLGSQFYIGAKWQIDF
jgi:hypothetical protein